MVFNNNLLLGAAAQGGGYEIDNSLRLNYAGSAYLSKTPSAGDRDLWTLSFWMKFCEGTTTSRGAILSVGSVSNRMDIVISNALGTAAETRSLAWFQNTGGSSVAARQTSMLFRDPAAWYHMVLIWDSANATADDRMRVYVNGVRVTAFGTTTNPSSGTDSYVNSNSAHNIGRRVHSSDQYFNGYLSHWYFIDGFAEDPYSFGEFNSNGVWVPKGYSGSFGTTGYFLDFSDSSDLGNDVSGNNNDWTTNNIDSADQVIDTPTDNYCIINASEKASNNGVPRDGNLQTLASSSGNYDDCYVGNVIVNYGKWYWEVTAGHGYSYLFVGVTSKAGIGVINPNGTQFAGYGTADPVGAYYVATGNKIQNDNSGVGVAYGSSYTTNDVIGIALDVDNGAIWFSKNGVWQASANVSDIEAGVTTNAAFTNLVGSYTACVIDQANNTTMNLNFGQLSFIYTPPSGFKTLSSVNLSTPGIKDGSKYFNTILYTGDGNTRSLTGVGFQPDLVWTKSRSNAETHKLVDSVRGVTKALSSETTGDEVTESGLTSFDSDGFTLDGATDIGYNTNTYTYAAWNWKLGTTPGFDVVTYTGNGANRTVSHSLGAVPKLIIVKARTTASTDQGWAVYHSSNTTAPETDYLLLNSTAATADLDTVWNDTAPTSSVFSLGTNALVNTNNDTYVAYLWSEIEGFSKFGSYNGNGNANGPFVWCGFRPAWVLFKQTNILNNWILYDATRNEYNFADKYLYPDTTSPEGTYQQGVDLLSNGFKLRHVNFANTSGGIYIFAAFAESPFKTANAR